ncbi:MAG: hypothetical protein Q7R52_04115 [archaeon]|nr:hypothetical protein [archaeon]
MINKNKKGFVELSFGMIFSIILIIVFLVFAVYAITKFLEIRDVTLNASFFNDLQTDVNKMWESDSGSAMKTYNLPRSAEYICFVDYTTPSNTKDKIYEELKFSYTKKENTFVYPLGKNINSKEIANIDIVKITQTENPLCFEAKGKFSMIIKKNYGESLVRIERPI